MSRYTQTVSINFTGGIISPGHLLTILDITVAARVSKVQFGLRQQLLIEVPGKYYDQFEAACRREQIPFYAHGIAPNITSSYPAAGIFINDGWLTEGIYKDIFALFDYIPGMKVNICDNRQTFTPFFSGHINWIAAGPAHYWYLFIRFPKSSRLFAWPDLIYTNHIAQVSQCVEALLAATPDIDNERLYAAVIAQLEYTSKPVTTELELPMFHLPYYEGFNRHENHYWLGIYRRDQEFSVAFLRNLCNICLETKTGQIYATSWKSLIIKNIAPEHRRLWDYVLGKYGINVRHAANELNWYVEDNSEDALIIKRHIIRHFDNADVRTYGLCFSIRINPGNNCFGSIIISKQEDKFKSRLKGHHRYDISYTQDFNPNSGTLLVYRAGVAKEHLGPYITSLCREFYENSALTDPLITYVAGQQTVTAAKPVEKIVHQCVRCLTIYDETVGDPDQAIAPGTTFEQLPDTYLCSLCDAPLYNFAMVPATSLGWLGGGQD
ncbi:rubredoxin [Chitinophaga rhizophila]|uniref:Rubredoxin n=1 Tax=Chitinophaga rhizophila TaxID=2866212 RepID=A0ABS7G866_9BACT|nr:rubredoxin [Chitinophaga rhizophila]MBW8683646.1 rubredoxin [Chitinophaga rhizophila]